MTFFLLSMVLVAATVSVVRPAMGSGPRIPLVGVTGSHVIILSGFLFVVGAVFGLAAAAGLFTAYVLHEIGHVLGHRLAGHPDVRFRFLPLARSGPVSRAPHDSDLAAFFTALMGPGVSLAPMVFFFAVADLFAGHPFGHLFGTLAMTIGAYNFVALLPVWPLPGGKMVQLLVRHRFPRVSPIPAAVFLAGLTSLAWTLEAPLLFLLSLTGALAYIMQPDVPDDRPALSWDAVRFALPAYVFTLASFFLGGWWVILLAAGQF